MMRGPAATHSHRLEVARTATRTTAELVNSGAAR